MAWRKLGVKPGDRVVLHLGNSTAAAIACYATMMIGAIVFPMNCRYAPGEVKRLIERLRPALYGGLSDVDTALLPLERRFVIAGFVPDSGMKSWNELFDAGLQPWPSDQYPDAPIILVSTSGTTSEPKLVVHTQNTISHSMFRQIQFVLV